MRFAKNAAHWAIARMRTEPNSTRRVVFIIQTKADGKSITNDANAVVHDLNQMFTGCRIFYRDTEGRWDELKHDFGVFTGFRPGTDGWEPPS